MDQNVGGQLILFSGVFGAGFFCWLVPPSRLQQALGTESRWWVTRIYLVGRWLPVAVLAWIGITLVW